MRMRAALAALLLFAAPAFAQLKYDPTLNSDGSEKADSLLSAKPGVTYSRRLAMVVDSPGRTDVYSQSSVQNTKKEIEISWGNLKDVFEERGIQVDVYSSALFTRKANRTNFLWQRMGTYYPVTICVGFVMDGTQPNMFANADSTTTHIIHLTPSGVGIGPAAQNATPAVMSVDSLDGVTTTSGVGGAMRAALKVYQNGDTLWMPMIPVGGRNVTLPTGASSVTRLLHPIVVAATEFTATADTNNYSMPASYDSTALSHEWLGPAWRVNFTASGRGVDYVKSLANGAIAYNIGALPYALAARWLDVQPIKVAMELDDITDVSTPNVRGTNATWDSLMTGFQNSYSFKPTFSFNPLHAEQYINGTDPTGEAAWTQGDGWSWIRKWNVPWVHHSHDSTIARPTSTLVGRSNGYDDSTLANGVRRFMHRVYANRFNPGSTVDNEKKYGIYQKLAYMDSLRALNCSTCPLAPYISFPGNFAIAGNWRTRTNVANPSWGLPPASRTGSTAPSGIGYRSQGDCPPDSMFIAMAKGLRIPSGGTLYLRAVQSDGTGSSSALAYAKPGAAGDNSVFKVSLGADSDSLIANSYFTVPDEEQWFADAAGYRVKVKAIGYATLQTSSSIDIAVLDGWGFLVKAGGFVNSVQYASPMSTLSSSGTTWFGESHSADINGLGQASAFNQRNFMGKMHLRMGYFHPRSTPNATDGSYNIEMLRRSALTSVRALNAFAGKTIYKWVYPWELYDNK